MYLSRILLNPRNAQARKEISAPYQLHRTLMRAFPQDSVRVVRGTNLAAGVLFRLEQDSRQGILRVLVQSSLLPDWGFLSGKQDARGQSYLLPDDLLPDELANPSTKELDMAGNVQRGSAFSFRLRANPTKRLGKSSNEAPGKRVGLEKEEQQLNWLKRKASLGGFCILHAEVSQDALLEDIVRDPITGEHSLTLIAVQFDGVLQVTDQEQFVKTLINGIGSAKGFGFGLLSLAPAGG